MNRITKTEMQEQRSEERKGDVIEQVHGQIEILSKIQCPVNVKHERSETNDREVQNERSPAALFEKDKETDAEPDQSDNGQENDRGRPTWQRIDIPQIGVVEVVRELVRGFLVVVGQSSADARCLEVHGNIRDGNNLVVSSAIKANGEKLIARRDTCPRSGQPRGDLLGVNAVGPLDPQNAVGRGKLMVSALRQV